MKALHQSMAAKPREVVQLKAKSTSAPRAPRFRIADSSHRRPRIASIPERDDPPMPHYQKPTISWCNEVCTYGHQSKLVETQASAKRKLSIRRSIDKPPSSISQPRKIPFSTRNPKTLSSSMKQAISNKPILYKASKIARSDKAKALTNAKILPRAPLTKVKSQEEKVLLVKVHKPSSIAKPAIGSIPSPKQEEINEHELDDGNSGEGDNKGEHLEDFEEDIVAKVKLEQVSEVVGNEEEESAEGERLKFEVRVLEAEAEAVTGGRKEKAEQGSTTLKKEVRRKKAASAGNDVIEETTKRMGEERRNKVKALVGAFETVISMQEPEDQPSQQGQAPQANKEGEQSELTKQGEVREEEDGSKVVHKLTKPMEHEHGETPKVDDEVNVKEESTKHKEVVTVAAGAAEEEMDEWIEHGGSASDNVTKSMGESTEAEADCNEGILELTKPTD